MNRKYKYDDYKHNRTSREGPDYYSSGSPHSSKRKRHSSPPAHKLSLNEIVTKNKHELSSFLKDRLSVRNTGDFWKFFDKYQTIQASKGESSNTFDKRKLINLTFDCGLRDLHDKLPVNIPKELFGNFVQAVLVYQDFQQKSKFAKLKKLRSAQRDLPIAQYKEKIINTLQDSRVVLIAGDTGCGKSTQVPQYILEAGYTKVVCTQPRRIACVSLAKRVAYETLTDFKTVVGYQIRFEKTKRADTAVIFMTEGLLLRQAAEEETISTYDIIILDEIHERHLYGDFLIGIMKCLLHKRDDFKLILMSATINIQLFENYFANEDIKVIQVPGRLYPIEIQYKPIVKDPYERKRDRFDCSPYLQIIQMIDEKYPPHHKGDLLVFLNGIAEITALADAVTEYSSARQNWIVLQLHSTLSLEEQDKVFDYAPDGVRKCIISTNIAETSVTIDGVRFVVDSGKVNRMVYHTSGGINKLMETNISQDSAKQRSGRAGRTGPGVCYRMYSEADFKNFDAFTTAEIHLVPLESLLLHMISLGLNDIQNFPFLEKPSASAIEESIERLKFCGALKLNDDYLTLTPLGDALSRLPVDLTIGRMLIMSTVFGNVNSVLTMAALLSIQSPLTQQAYRSSDMQNARKPLESTHGDPISLLSMYKEWLCIKQDTAPATKTSRAKENTRTWAKKRGLEEQRFYEAAKLVQQFRDILQDAELLSKGPEQELSSGERAIRHGELKQLKALRRNLKNEARSTQRKLLKYEAYAVDTEDGSADSPKLDIRDVEFRITNDYKKLQKLLDESSPESHKDLMMLKIILTSGLYPQVAVEDEFNYSKSVTDRLYHTKSKNFVFLRPLSCFTTNPEVLELHADDIEVPPPGYFSKRPISRKHQILVYQTILETKKVYLVNVMRMPALQTLLMFSKTIATNATLTKFVFDEFLLIDAPHFGQGKTMLLRAITLRKKWKTQLEDKLRDPSLSSESNAREIFYFIEDLVKFMSTEATYNIKRLLPADIKVIYNYKEDLERVTSNPFDADFAIVPNKSYGGMQVTENVVYDCLVQEEWANAIEDELYSTPFECPHCLSRNSGLSFLQIIQHESSCRKPDAALAPAESAVEKVEVIKPNSRSFHCDKCQKDFNLTPVDILKHKRTCGAT